MSQVANMVKAESTANAAVTLTISGVTDYRNVVDSLVVTFDSTAPTSSLQIIDNVTVKGDIDLYVAAFMWPFGPLSSSPNTDLKFTVAAAGASVIAKITAEMGG